jgi:hypothetical protein
MTDRKMDVEGCAARVRAFAERGGYRRVALEMDEAHLAFAAPLCALLGDARRFFVQGERWHGGCCVDTVGDAHAGADAAVHFGEWCFGLPAGLGLLLEPDRRELPPLPAAPPPRGSRLLAHLSLAHHESGSSRAAV